MWRRLALFLAFIVTLSLALILIARVVAGTKAVSVGRTCPRESADQHNPKYDLNDVKSFTFSDNDSLREWEEKVFKGKVVYAVEKSDNFSYVRAKSDASASALYYKIKLDTKNKRPVISWKWKVVKFPAKRAAEKLNTENEDDFAGRVYVIFPALFITNYKVLEYIWAEQLPVGLTGDSPYSKNIKLIVLESGPAKDGKFVFEERDIISDYVKVFCESPERDVGAVAFMTNAEHTNTSADAMYDEIGIGYKKE